MPIPQMWSITQRWYGDRLDPDWRPATVTHLQSILTDAGLTAPFWQLT